MINAIIIVTKIKINQNVLFVKKGLFYKMDNVYNKKKLVNRIKTKFKIAVSVQINFIIIKIMKNFVYKSIYHM